MSSASDFGLTDREVVYELASFLHSSILDIMGYGLYTSIYFVALYLILSRGADGPRVGSAILITAMWIPVTIHTNIAWAYLDSVYIQYGESRQTELISLLSFRFEELFLQSVADAGVTFISLLLADITMIWRCGVLCGRRWLLIILPVICLVTGSVCRVWRTILLLAPNVVWETDTVNNLELTFLSTTVLTNIFCTTAIVYRPLRVHGWRKARGYRRIVETLIESSILYTAVYVIRIGLQIHTQYCTRMNVSYGPGCVTHRMLDTDLALRVMHISTWIPTIVCWRPPAVTASIEDRETME